MMLINYLCLADMSSQSVHTLKMASVRQKKDLMEQLKTADERNTLQREKQNLALGGTVGINKRLFCCGVADWLHVWGFFWVVYNVQIK